MDMNVYPFPNSHRARKFQRAVARRGLTSYSWGAWVIAPNRKYDRIFKHHHPIYKGKLAITLKEELNLSRPTWSIHHPLTVYSLFVRALTEGGNALRGARIVVGRVSVCCIGKGSNRGMFKMWFLSRQHYRDSLQRQVRLDRAQSASRVITFNRSPYEVPQPDPRFPQQYRVINH